MQQKYHVCVCVKASGEWGRAKEIYGKRGNVIF